MKIRASAILACCLGLVALAAAPQVRAQDDNPDRDKLAQTGMKFLSVPLDPRAAAMSDAMTGVEGGAVMLFSNPAGMARLEGAMDASLGQVQWIADIGYNFGSIAFKPLGEAFGVVGISLLAVDYGELQETIRAENDQGFVDLGTFSPSAWSVGLGYARAVTDRFSVGGQVKYVSQDLGESPIGGTVDALERGSFQQGVMAYDFGVLYRTGYRKLNIAFSARNYASEIAFREDGDTSQLPLTLRMGVSMDVLNSTSGSAGMHSLILSADAEHPRDFAEQIKIGGEYTFLNTFSLRAGYTFPTDEQGVSLGAGIRQELSGVGFGADYAYTSFGIFSNVHRIALRFSL